MEFIPPASVRVTHADALELKKRANDGDKIAVRFVDRVEAIAGRLREKGPRRFVGVELFLGKNRRTRRAEAALARRGARA